MEASTAQPRARPLESRRHVADRAGDLVLRGLTGLAAAVIVGLFGFLVYKVVRQAWPAIDEFGLAFLWHETWDPVKSSFGALDFIYGTVLTSFLALLVAAPISIAIGLFLSELAPRGTRGVIGTLVEMLAAVPSVILGLWGILILGPVVQHQIGPWLQAVLGWTPFFAGTPQVSGQLSAVIILTIMIVPITTAISRELFVTVPRDIKEGAVALGLTRWEMVRGVVLPYTRGGVVAATLLGLGRALGEAIAVTQVIGNSTGIHLSLFDTGDTLASRIASQYQGAVSNIQIGSIVYLAVILLVFELAVNVAARVIVRRFEVVRGG